MPIWASYTSAIAFAHRNEQWIISQLALSTPQVLRDGSRIGKSHTLRFVDKPGAVKVRTRISATEVLVVSSFKSSSIEAQTKAVQACERALKLEAQQLLPYRLSELAKKHGYKYRDLKIRRLTSRWGSCSSSDDIALSYYLIQLPWALIDYVLLHELVHTVHKHHKADFWETLEAELPTARQLRRELKNWRPALKAL